MPTTKQMNEMLERLRDEGSLPRPIWRATDLKVGDVLGRFGWEVLSSDGEQRWADSRDKARDMAKNLNALSAPEDTFMRELLDGEFSITLSPRYKIKELLNR